MNRFVISFLVLGTFSLISCSTIAQDNIIRIKVDNHPSEIEWKNAEKQSFNETWQTETVANVSAPKMEVFRPSSEKNNGTAMIVCPGGGMYLLSIESEGNQVARWLADKGVTAFVLKYRLVPTGEDGAREFMDGDGSKVIQKAKDLLKYSREDALNAIEYIRHNAEDYGIDPNKIGLMGFSAGGALTMEATYKSNELNRPNFIAPIYAWMNIVEDQPVPEYKPPAFILCATDDPLDLAPASVKIYSEWISKGANAELHMYSKGGHGFGMRIQNMQTDNWIERLGDWMKQTGYLNK